MPPKKGLDTAGVRGKLWNRSIEVVQYYENGWWSTMRRGFTLIELLVVIAIM